MVVRIKEDLFDGERDIELQLGFSVGQSDGTPKCSYKTTAGMCRKLLKQESWLWTFVRVEGIEPTNNDAERVLRHAVLWRKSSGGTDSDAGARFVERMLSVVATCRQQNRNVLELLTACCRARLDGSAAPSLLPGVGRALNGYAHGHP